MKNVFLLTLIGCLFFLGACDNLDTVEASQDLMVEPTQASAPDQKKKVVSYDFDLSGKKDGYYTVAKSPTTGRILRILVRSKDVASISFVDRDGKVGKFTDIIYRSSYDNPNPQAPPLDIFDCPDTWNWRCVCYTHPVYGYLCFSFCTPTQLTFSVPTGW